MSGRLCLVAAGVLGLAVFGAGAVGCGSGKSGRAATEQRAGPTVAEAREAFEQGQAAQKRGKLDEAAEHYRRAVAIAPSMGQAWNNLGVVYMEQRRYLEAAAALQTAADVWPRDPRPIENLGLAYLEAGYAERALEAFQRALAREPNRVEALRGAFTASRQLRLADEAALERVERALLVDQDPQWREVYERERLWLKEEVRVAPRTGRR